MRRVVVIGGGVTGVLSAWELARAGHEVTLVEARALGSGASSRSAAGIRAQFGLAATVSGQVYSERFYEGWTERLPSSQPCFTQNGYLFLKSYADDLDAVRALVRMQRQAGLAEVEFLDRAAVDERWPFLDTTGVTAATWCPRDGFLFPAVIYQDGAEAARALGATIVQNDAVVGAERDGGLARAVALASGRRIEADVFVNAAGFMANTVSKMFGGRDLPITVERRYVYFLTGLKAASDWGLGPEDFPRLPMIVTPCGAYARPENAQLLMGWLQFPKPVAATLDNQDEVEPGFGIGATDYGAAVRKEVTQVLPAAQDMGRLASVTTGFYDVTPDHNPLFGYDGAVGNLVHAAGFSGHGLMHAPFSALIVAELVARGADVPALELPFGLGPVDLGIYALDRSYDLREGLVI
ncbi:MAG TPA: FAD-binding oxidoreductase [Candidatus Aminicenantes bacterium]|nr:FAD-binding oxidoreductase [Candidatus Aminicenantes bacterium]